MVHGDLKPANILVGPGGDLKILDFGTAKLLDPESQRPVAVTAAASRMVTAEYAAPEQLAMAESTTAVDVYSLGVVLYELLTGRRPFERAEDPARFLRRVLGQDPAPPSSHRPGLPADLDALVLRALRKAPEERYPSVESLGRDLADLLAHRPIRACGDGFAYRLSKLLRRRRRELAAAALGLLALAAFGVDRELSRRQLVAEKNKAVVAQDFLTDLVTDLDPYTRSDGGPPVVEDLVESRIEKLRELEGMPELKATLLKAFGRFYGNQGRHEQSLSMIREAVGLFHRSLPASDRRIFEAETLLGDALRFAGKNEEAEEALRRALEQVERSPEADETDRAATSLSLGQALLAQGKTEEAETLFRQALSVLEALEQQDEYQRMLSVKVRLHLGFFCLSQEDAQEALVHFEAGWKAASREWGALDSRAAYMENGLAQALFLAGRREEAVAHLEASIEGFRATLGEHRDLGQALLVLGGWWHEAGEADRARGALLEARAVLAAAPGSHGLEMADCERLLASLPPLTD